MAVSLWRMALCHLTTTGHSHDDLLVYQNPGEGFPHAPEINYLVRRTTAGVGERERLRIRARRIHCSGLTRIRARMKIALLVFVGVLVVAVVAYLLIFPRNMFISFSRPSGGTVTFSRMSVSFEAAPDHYATNGFDHIEPYISRLLVPTNCFKFLHMFTPDGTRGFGFDAKDGVVNAGLTVEWRQESQRETAIRSFFGSLGIAPSRDYLAGNGGIPDATRVLDYPINGSITEVTALTKRILQELCGVSPTEALDISYSDK